MSLSKIENPTQFRSNIVLEIDKILQKTAEDYYDAREEVIMEWFLSQEPRSIRKLATKYFDCDLEDAWNFIQEYNIQKSVDNFGNI